MARVVEGEQDRRRLERRRLTEVAQTAEELERMCGPTDHREHDDGKRVGVDLLPEAPQLRGEDVGRDLVGDRLDRRDVAGWLQAAKPRSAQRRVETADRGVDVGQRAHVL